MPVRPRSKKLVLRPAINASFSNIAVRAASQLPPPHLLIHKNCTSPGKSMMKVSMLWWTMMLQGFDANDFASLSLNDSTDSLNIFSLSEFEGRASVVSGGTCGKRLWRTRTPSLSSKNMFWYNKNFCFPGKNEPDLSSICPKNTIILW